MKLLIPALMVAAGCHAESSPSGGADASFGGQDAGASASSIFDSVDRAQLNARLEELTGATPVTAGGSTFQITNRWSPKAKASFRAYWTQYFVGLGATVNELPFAIPNLVGETHGHNLEAVLPGQSADSVVIIVHYDSVGITGKEELNPAADDDGSGLAIQMEAGRIFAAHPNRQQTVRFVAADYEEISDNLDGDYAYVKYLQAEALAKGFKILVASDDDQTGWSCWSEGKCGANPPAKDTTFQMISCSGGTDNYSYPELSRAMIELASQHQSPLTPTALCDDSGDTDHFPFWVAGIPAYVIEEYGSENNPHYDDTGDDTMAHIDLDLLTETSKVQIALQAQLAGID